MNIVTKKPQAERFSRLKASAGSWDRYRASLDVNAPLNDAGTLRSRINLATEDNGSFRDHVGNQRLVVSPSLSWQLNPDTRLLLETEFVQHESVFDRGIPAVNREMGTVKRSTFLGEPNDGEIRNRNQMIQTSLEHHLNEGWKLRLAKHYAQGHLQGDSSETSRLIGAQVTKDNVLPEGSRLFGVPKHSGSLPTVYEFQNGRLRGSDVGAAFNSIGDRSGQAGSPL